MTRYARCNNTGHLTKGEGSLYGTHPAPADSQWKITFED